jgi:uncharacterized protein YcbK (DUF882 family)
MGDLTKNISIDEMLCKCGKCQFSKPFPEAKEWFLPPAKQLQKFRDWINKTLKPEKEIQIIIKQGHCGIRCKNHNFKVGGKLHSRHLPRFYSRGQGAIDFHCTGISGRKLRKYFKMAWKLGIISGGAGLYKNFVHSDTSTRRFWGRFWGKP